MMPTAAAAHLGNPGGPHHPGAPNPGTSHHPQATQQVYILPFMPYNPTTGMPALPGQPHHQAGVPTHQHYQDVHHFPGNDFSFNSFNNNNYKN